MGFRCFLLKNTAMTIILAYFAVISLWAIGLTLYDKRAAHKGSWRVKERTLLLVALFGGSVAMLAWSVPGTHRAA